MALQANTNSIALAVLAVDNSIRTAQRLEFIALSGRSVVVGTLTGCLASFLEKTKTLRRLVDVVRVVILTADDEVAKRRGRIWRMIRIRPHRKRGRHRG